MANKKSAKVVVTKLNAAGRQLNTAIRLLLGDDDLLSIHTLTAAAYRILRDLQKARGILHYPEVIRVGLWSMAEDFRKGRPLDELPPDLRPYVRHVADLQAAGKIASFNEIKFANEQVLELNDLRQSTKAANFLKHADRDQTASLSEDEIDNIDLLFRATGTYSALLHRLSPEMAAFTVYAWDLWGASFPSPSEPLIARLIQDFKGISLRQRKAKCRRLIRNKQFRDYFEVAVK